MVIADRKRNRFGVVPKAGVLSRFVVALALSLVFALWVSPPQALAAKATLEEQVIQIMRDHPEVILESVNQYQTRQKEKARQQQQQVLDAIQKAPQDFIGTSPMQGELASGVLLMEFSDFQCPYCGEAHKTLKTFLQEHQDQVTLVYKHYPLEDIHPEAMAAAKAAWAAQQQGKFWEYQNFLFTHQEQLGEKLYLKGAKRLRLDMVQFEQDLNSEGAFTSIRNDMQLADRLGLSGTPFFVIGNEAFSGILEKSFLEEKLAQMEAPA